MTAASRPQPDGATTTDPEPQLPAEEPRVIVRRRSPGWPVPPKTELPRTDEASD